MRKTKATETIAIMAITTLLSVGNTHKAVASPTDSIVISKALEEVAVTAMGSRKMIRLSPTGEMSISSRLLMDLPSFMGGNDPMSLLRSLPAVGTANELSSAISVRGGSSAGNLFESDGVRIMNPMHMLGLYSAFNSSFYDSFTFTPGSISVTMPNLTGGYFGAKTVNSSPDTIMGGSLSAGLIESHGAIRMPLRKGVSSLALGARTSYLNLLFPSILKSGSSTLNYGFTDINSSFTWKPDDRNLLHFSFFGNHDMLKVENRKQGTKEGSFGWYNMAAGVGWTADRLSATAGVSGFRNKFILSEGGRDIDLPSSFLQTSVDAKYQFSTVALSGGAVYRDAGGQGRRGADGKVPGESKAWEFNIAAEWQDTLFNKLHVVTGWRGTLYTCGDYTRFLPMPRIRATWQFNDNLSAYLSAGSYVRFDRIVEETANGLPADFYVNVDDKIQPEEVQSLELGLNGILSVPGIEYSVEGYYKLISRTSEYNGSLLDLVNNGYNPLDHVINGRGYAYGLSVSVMRQWGKLRGRISYNLGKSRLKFSEYGDTYLPSAHDRLHDLNINLSWTVFKGFTFNVSYVHATGTPYTRARYGYMIGENLICEYYPHNSSRLPAYNRTDISATWVISQRGRIKHTLNLSVYNALANRNVLFTFSTYSPDKGIREKESVMRSVIPSLSYIFDF